MLRGVESKRTVDMRRWTAKGPRSTPPAPAATRLCTKPQPSTSHIVNTPTSAPIPSAQRQLSGRSPELVPSEDGLFASFEDEPEDCSICYDQSEPSPDMLLALWEELRPLSSPYPGLGPWEVPVPSVVARQQLEYDTKSSQQFCIPYPDLRLLIKDYGDLPGQS